MKKIFVESKRNTHIPALVFEPEHCEGLLLLAHSFRSGKEEDGRFIEVGRRLAERGWFCIAPDFPGNGESEEPFSSYSLRSSLDDLESCYAYAERNHDFDRRKLALLGYSMGGRIIAMFLRSHPECKSLVFWAAANEDYDEGDLFLEQDLAKLLEEADEKGNCAFYDIFLKETVTIGRDLVEDLLQSDALTPLESFEGRALIIQGEKDTTIKVSNAKTIYDHLSHAKERRLLYFSEADHGFGLWDEREEDSLRLIEETVNFLSEKY